MYLPKTIMCLSVLTMLLFALGVSPSFGVPPIGGQYTGSYTITVSNCSDPSSDGMFQTTSMVMDIVQNLDTFTGTINGTFNNDSNFTEYISISGTITESGQLSGVTNHTFLGTRGNGTFVGQWIDNTLSIDNTGQDTEGETCEYTRCITATRSESACADECVSGQTRCNGYYVQVCADYDGDECLEWPCSIGSTGSEFCTFGCWDGQCQTGLCLDADGDGYGVCPDCGASNECTFDGDDCNDEDEDINPGATEIINDGIDQDCDGEDFRILIDTGLITSAGFVDPDDPYFLGIKPPNLIIDPIDIRIYVAGKGDTTVFTVLLPISAPPEYVPYKHTDRDGWINFSRDVISGGTGDGAEFIDPDRRKLQVYVTDGSRYDDNPTEGSIRDPITVGSTPIGTDDGCFIDTIINPLGW